MGMTREGQIDIVAGKCFKVIRLVAEQYSRVRVLNRRQGTLKVWVRFSAYRDIVDPDEIYKRISFVIFMHRSEEV